MHRRLLVIDHYDAAAIERATADRSIAWDVALLGIDLTWFRLTASAPQADERLRYLDAGALAAVANDRVGAFVLEAIDRLADTPVDGVELWRALRDAGSSWWYLPISEKGPYRTPLVFRLYQLALLQLFRAAQDYERVVVVTRQSWLAQLLRRQPDPPAVQLVDPVAESPAPDYWRHAIGAALNIAAAKIAGRGAAVAPRRGSWIFSLFPAWWSGASSSAPRERFFADPVEDMSFVCWTHPPAQSLASGASMTRLAAYTPWAAVRRVLSIRRFSALSAIASAARRIAGFTFAGVDVTPLLISDLTRSLMGPEPMQDELIAAATTAFAVACEPRMVLYRAECQPFEHAMVDGLRGRSASVGFSHYPYGRRYLPAYDRSNSGGAERPAGRARPRPDAMLSCGELGRRHLVDAGMDPARIATCGPQRHPHLLAWLRDPVSRPAARQRLGLDDSLPVFLVAIALVEADSEALFGAVIEAIAEMPCRLLVRTHPNRPDGDAALAAAVRLIGPDRARRLGDEVPLYDAIAASDAMITIGSTVAYEAMALGCQPISFEPAVTYGALSLEESSEAIYIAHDAGELRAALEDITADNPSAGQRRARWPQAVSEMFGDVATALPIQLASAIETLSPALGVS